MAQQEERASDPNASRVMVSAVTTKITLTQSAVLHRRSCTRKKPSWGAVVLLIAVAIIATILSSASFTAVAFPMVHYDSRCGHSSSVCFHRPTGRCILEHFQERLVWIKLPSIFCRATPLANDSFSSARAGAREPSQLSQSSPKTAVVSGGSITTKSVYADIWNRAHRFFFWAICYQLLGFGSEFKVLSTTASRATSGACSSKGLAQRFRLMFIRFQGSCRGARQQQQHFVVHPKSVSSSVSTLSAANVMSKPPLMCYKDDHNKTDPLQSISLDQHSSKRESSTRTTTCSPHTMVTTSMIRGGSGGDDSYPCKRDGHMAIPQTALSLSSLASLATGLPNRTGAAAAARTLRAGAHRIRSARPTMVSFRATSSNGLLEPESSSQQQWQHHRATSLSLLWRQCVAEFCGTALLVGLGTGAVMSAVAAHALTDLASIAAVWMVAVTVAISTTSGISGAHLNPAVSVSMAWLRPSDQFNWHQVVPYITAQTLGATAASALNWLLYSTTISQFEQKAGIVRSAASWQAVRSAKMFGQYYAAPVTTAQAFAVEAAGTAILAFVIFALTNSHNTTMQQGPSSSSILIPSLIGWTVAGLICVFAPLTQAGFNPARDFGPRLVAYAAGWTGVAFWQAWLYIVAPLVGAPIGAWLADHVLYHHREK